MEGLIKLHNTFHGIGWLNKLFEVITSLGNVGFIWLFIAFVLFCFKKTRKSAVVMAVSLAVGYVFNNLILKNLFDRLRPFEEYSIFKDFLVDLGMDLPDGSSFPSGHAFSSFLCATVLCLFHKKAGYITFPLAFLIGLSRIYLCVHYPTDVLAGAIIGIIFAFVCYYVYRLIEKKITKVKRDKIRNNNGQS